MSTDLPADVDGEGIADGIAVVGMAGRFPGAPDVRAYWDNLAAGVDSVTAAASGPRGTIAGHDLFDAEFFGFSPKEAERTDPQHRLFLECAWEALEHAGYGNAATRPVTGVYAGSSTSRYLFDVLASPRHRDLLDDSQLLIGCDKDYLATRVSHKLDLRGPSVVVQTACSTSLVAVHLASQALFAGECDLALAGGVSVRTGEGLGRRSDRADGMVSPDGRCRAFDASANGMVGGDGVGLVALRRLDDALRDGDTVYAVILGSAVNNDGGRKVGYTAPGVAGQERVIRAAHLAADVDPSTIGYVEAHGTGTRLGDPVEVAALASAFGAGAECVLGSVKTNIGHLDVAAGIASLIKVVLAMGHRVIPPTLHFERPNPELGLSDTRFRVSGEPVAWQPIDGVRRAGVSSFGIGGTNAHVVVEEPPPVRTDTPPTRPWQVIPVSARTPAARDRAAAAVGAALSDVDLAGAAYTLQTGRQEFEYRAAMVAPGGRFHSGRAAALPVAFLCTGQGAQYPGMASGLADEPVFAESLAECLELLDLRSDDLADTSVAQPMLFAVEYALARLWRSWGVEPVALMGHSVGELTAACLAGVLSLEDGALLVKARGEAMAEAAPGAMLTVALPSLDLPAGVTVAAVNSPTQTVVAGDEPAIADLERSLRASGVACRRLPARHAFHTPAMDHAAQKVAKAAASVTLRPPTKPLISNVTGKELTDAEATDPSYWGRQVREPVRFADGLRTLATTGTRAVVELGPGRSLCDLAGAFALAVPSLPGAKSSKDSLEVTLDSLARLWVAGQPVKWAALHEGTTRRRVALPTYPFERQRYTVATDAPIVAASEPAPVESEVDGPTETEELIAGIWARSLGAADVDRDRSFFEIGGNSLAGMQVLDEIARTFAVELPLGVLYDHPTIAELALVVEDAIISSLEEAGS